MLLPTVLSLVATVSAKTYRRSGGLEVNDPLLPMNSIGSDCPLAGPDFPAPKYLSNSAVFAAAVERFEVIISNASLGIKPNDTAWGIALFSSKENKTVYESYYTPPINVSVPVVDRDSIFRIGSISKVFTVWTFLINAGDALLNEPVTKYVPELASTVDEEDKDENVVYDDINAVRWDEVTLGNLASQAAGIPRDATLGDLTTLPADLLAQFGFPTIDPSEAAVCGTNETTVPCDRDQFFYYLRKQHPIFPAGHSPAYSNIAFAILGYALENITGRSLNESMTEDIFQALDMTHSSYNTTPSTGGVIPGDPVTGAWDWDIGPDNAAGSLYMSTGDLVKAGMAILQSTLLPKDLTRRWLKPFIQTGYVGALVGAPFEVTYLESPNNRLIQYYTKQGDINFYHTAMVLSPEHEVGWVVLVAGTLDSKAPTIRKSLMNLFGEVFMPAVEEQSKVEAGINFNGTYYDPSTNSSVTILAGENGHVALGIVEFISNGVELVGPNTSPIVRQSLGFGNVSRLFPTTLKTVSKKADGSGTYESRLGFRMTFLNQDESGNLVDPCLNIWASLGGYIYGQRTLDDWVFELNEDGEAVAVDIRMMRVRLVKDK